MGKRLCMDRIISSLRSSIQALNPCFLILIGGVTIVYLIGSTTIIYVEQPRLDAY